ncbi:cytochrome c3 family protein [Oceanicoccus sp. KOV_DT_Chl]|uniref:cytochrome c3 family protein n=1 Tax=Oceanicoccus sp. KOV_DT_Chl TaxID=1904639 RepID=UPI000C7E50D8|nr:cytochrome c3 family protein [Oceanicoccus sp. KOV_DT_Chl]
MDFLLREVGGDKGLVVYQDTELNADAISIGSAPDQLIQLRGGSIQRAQAELKMSAGQLSVAGVGKNTVTVNGEKTASAALKAGDIIELESHKIKILPAPAGFDAACEVQVDSDLQNHALESAYVTSLAQTSLGKRAPSYLLSLLIVLAVLVWPVSAYYLRDNPVDEVSGQQQYDKKSAGDILWSSGPLLPAHQLEVGDNCSACHKVPFQTVQDEACVDCHQDEADHFAYEKVQHGGDLGALHIDLGVTECQSCHKEHNEPAAMVVTADSLCVDCHVEPLQLTAETTGTAAVSGFDVGTHPDFKLNFLLPKVVEKGTGIGVKWYNRLESHSSAQKDMSNLKFPHDVHLDVDKVQTAGAGAGMVCSDCHTLKSDNEHFETITMEQHCSSCHDLSFDVADPDRQLPHGNPATVVQTIEEHFVRVYADPDYKPAGGDRKRRRPGQSGGAERCDGKPFDCGIKRATSEAGIQFTQRGCVTCHEVSDNQSTDLYARWTVLPVKINHDWYQRALFDHASHLTQRGKSENQTCSSCHQAMQSTTSGDVLIPAIDNCQSCHGDASMHEKVIVDCVSCHAFHPAAKLL